jgi:NodT family efflux transporter outer membrane factor (OMF) lipoprotein
MRAAKLAIVPVVISLIAACAGGGAQTKEHQQAVQSAVDSPESWATKSEQYEDVSFRWLESFDDPVMLKLISEGKANNLDLQVAAGNMDKAWLLAEQSGATLKPTADLTLGRAQSGSANSGSSSGTVNVGLPVSGEAAVWGRMRAGVSAAEASAEAAEADYVFAQHSLSANIAKTYLKVIEAKLQADITRKNLSILSETMRIAQVKYDNGISSGQDVALNRANLASAKEQLITIEGSQRDATRALEVLLGRYPDAALEMPDVLPKLPQPPPAGVPSEVLERRPDIVSAERRIASAFNATAQAEAARLPRFSLTSSVSGASSSLSDVLDPANVGWQLAANLVAPLFDGGRRKLDIEIANVEQRQAIANYAQTALAAFSEVETNLDQGSVLASRRDALSEVLEQSEKAYRIAELRYKEGETELLDTLQIQQQAISAESNLLSIQRLQLEQRINLYLSLGGEW